MATAHRALAATVSAVAAHAHASNTASATRGFGQTGSFSSSLSSGDACRFLLDPLRPALKLATQALAKAANDIINETIPGTQASDASSAMESGNCGCTFAASRPLHDLKVAMAAFYQAFDMRCRSLQPGHMRAVVAGLNSSTAVNSAGEATTAAAGAADATAAATSLNGGDGRSDTSTTPNTDSASPLPADRVLAGSTPAPVSPVASATGPSNENHSSTGGSTDGLVSVMSNLEVQAVNALVFSLLRCGQADLPRLADAVADLTERQSLFT